MHQVLVANGVNTCCHSLFTMRTTKFTVNQRVFAFKRTLFTRFAKVGGNKNPDGKQSPSKSVTKTMSPEDHCMETVKKYDYENFLSTLLISGSTVRRCAFAVRAFNVEMAQIRDLTSMEGMAQIRFQFWSDIIDEIYTTKGGAGINRGNQPVAYEIQQNYLISGGKLSKRWLKRLIESRSSASMLSSFPFKSLQEMEDYSDSSVSPVYFLAIEAAMNSKQESSKSSQLSSSSSSQQIKLDHIASHLGKAQGLSNILRGIPFNARHGRCYFPTELLVKHKVSQEDILRGKDTQDVKSVGFDVASVAHQHLDKSLRLLEDPEVKEWRLLFLPVYAVGIYLKKLEKTDFNVYSETLARRETNLPFKLWTKYLKIKYWM